MIRKHIFIFTFLIIIIKPFIVNSQVITSHIMPDSLYSGSIANENKDIVKDHSGNIWLATIGSLVKLNNNYSVIDYYSESNSALPHFLVQALAIDTFNKVWVGSAGGVLAEFNGIDNWTSYSPYVDVTGIKINNNNHIWFHSWNCGIAHYDQISFNWYNTQNSNIPSDDIFDISIQDDTIIWIATMNKGLIKFSNNNFTVFDTSNCGIASNVVYGIELDSNNVIYCGTDKGLSKYNGSTWQSITYINGSYITKCNPIFTDSDNYIWISAITDTTEKLLLRYNDFGCNQINQEFNGINLRPDRQYNSPMIEISKNKFALISNLSIGATIVEIDFFTEIKNVITTENLVIYPVPSSNIVNFKSDNKRIISIDIYSINGTIIDSYKGIKSKNFNIELENYEPGLYIAAIVYNNKKLIYKTIIKK